MNSIPAGDLYHVYNPYRKQWYNIIGHLVNEGWDNASERLDIFYDKHKTTRKTFFNNRWLNYCSYENNPNYANNLLTFHNIENVVHYYGLDLGGTSVAGYMAHAHSVSQFYGWTNHEQIEPTFIPSTKDDDLKEYIVYNFEGKDINVEVNETGLVFSEPINGGSKVKRKGKSKRNKKTKSRIRRKRKTKTKKKNKRKIKKQTRRK